MNTSSSPLAYKYRSGDTHTLERDLSALCDATFYAASRETLNDPFEGRFNRAELDAQLSAFEHLIAGLAPTASASLDAVSRALNEVLSFVDNSGVFSLSYSPLAELTWAHYGGSHQGFCIGYDLQKLLEFEPNRHHCLDVQYHDVTPTLQPEQLIGQKSPVAILQMLLGVKSSPWQYEQEVRVVTTPPGAHEHDYRAVKKILFGLRCPESTRVAVMEALAGRGVAYEQIESPEASYLLRSRPIADAFASAPKYRLNLAPINEGAIYPGHLKPDQKPYQTYLYKAAEIVRREPYCREIQLVNFSASKSTPQQPVICVQYLRAPNKWFNHYLTLPEIDAKYAELGLNENDT